MIFVTPISLRKLDSWSCQVLKELWWWFKPFWYNTGSSVTDYWTFISMWLFTLYFTRRISIV